jgi:pimeloyl-ACP methyl ester carboxylesterase
MQREWSRVRRRAACALFASIISVTALHAASAAQEEEDNAASELHAQFSGFQPAPLKFKPCPEDARAECGMLRVPVDYRKPFGGTTEIAVLRVKATNPHKRIGIAFQAPGGPGISGIDNTLRGLQLLPPAAVRVLERFDVITFDERGSGRSHAVHCDIGKPLGVPPTDDPIAAAKFLDDFSQRFASTCLEQNGPFIYSMSTNNIARDMDMVRRALGESKMTIFGASAGTELGAVYASMFPERVRAMVLDAGLVPEFGDSLVEFFSEQAIGFEMAFRRLDQDCQADTDCPVREPGVVAAFDTLSARLQAQPVPTPDGATLNAADLRNVVSDLLYIEPAWPAITGALADALKGDYGLFFARRIISHFRVRPALDTRIFDAYDVISCNDFATRRPASEIVPIDTALQLLSPRLLGPFELAGLIARCATWPTSDRPVIRDLSKLLPVPVLMVGNDFDPATPLTWTRRLAHAIGMEKYVLRYQGGGHGAYLTTGNTCIDPQVESYLFDRHLPKEGTVCAQQPLSFAR